MTVKNLTAIEDKFDDQPNFRIITN